MPDARSAPDVEQIQIFSRVRREHEPVEIEDWDFAQPARLAEDRRTALVRLHTRFAHRLGAELGDELRGAVELVLDTASEQTAGGFLGGRVRPGVMLAFAADGLGPSTLDIDPPVGYAMMDRLLGGRTDRPLVPGRPMSRIERRLMGRVGALAATALGEAWAPVVATEVALSGVEWDPMLVPLGAAGDPVIVIAFRIRLDRQVGRLHLALSSPLASGLLEGFARTMPTPATPATSSGPGAEPIAGIPIELRAELATTSLTVAEIRDLAVGDVISTGHGRADPVVVRAGGATRFTGRLGQVGSRLAVRLDTPPGG